MTKLERMIECKEWRIQDLDNCIAEYKCKIQGIVENGSEYDMMTFLPTYSQRLSEYLVEKKHLLDSIRELQFLAEEDK